MEYEVNRSTKTTNIYVELNPTNVETKTLSEITSLFVVEDKINLEIWRDGKEYVRTNFTHDASSTRFDTFMAQVLVGDLLKIRVNDRQETVL